mgnify:FL=1
MVVGIQKVHGKMADDYRKVLIQKYFPRNEWERAYKVMMGESGGRSDAVGDTQPIKGVLAPSVGLFQIRTLPGRPSATQLKDPEFNVRYAAQMQKEQGWKPWTAARKLGYAGKLIYASAGGKTTSVSGKVISNVENMDTSFTARANRWAKEARKHGWSESQISDFIDQKATLEGVKSGDISVKNIKDPSTLIKLKEEGIDIKDALSDVKDKLDVTEESMDTFSKLLDDKTLVPDRATALKRYEEYKPLMEKKGVDLPLIENMINSRFPEEPTVTEETGKGMFAESPYIRQENLGKIAGFFKNLFKAPTEEQQRWGLKFGRGKA